MQYDYKTLEYKEYAEAQIELVREEINGESVTVEQEEDVQVKFTLAQDAAEDYKFV